MAILNLLLLLTCSSATLPLASGIIDILKPILKISPARNVNTSSSNKIDYFGYSVTAHRLFSDPSGMSLQDILNDTIIIAGAPRGMYPGGLTDLELDWRVCQENMQNPIQEECEDNKAKLMNYTQEQIQECYDNLTTGLVYSCSLGSNSCTGLFGNGDTDPDAALFDSIGDYQENCKHRSVKKNQLMGSYIYSNGDYFMSCAPLYGKVSDTSFFFVTPNGRCLFSDRTLEDFTEVIPCPEGQYGTTQSLGSYCTAGFAGVIEGSQLIVGAPTDKGIGTIYNYSNINDLSKKTKLFDSGRDEYFGFNVASGYVTNQYSKDYIISQPSFRSEGPIGRIIVYNNNLPITSLFGKQDGEYFGYSLCVADLNDDGWDDLIVGAPFYSDISFATFKQDLGRIFVYYNDKGDLQMSAILNGYAQYGQFGTAITSLGDVNNDGFDDIAVSAPFEGSGVVYIFHGQELNEQGSIINMTVQQRIDGADVVKQVTNLTSVSSFGFSISGSVDVDNNQYRDLVIGAFESQSVFVLRSRSIAVANISLNIALDEIELDTFRCKHNGLPVNCFDVKVCTQYYGKGLESGFNTTYQLQEIVQTNQAPRLFFTNDSSLNSIIRNVHYTGINVSFCENVTVLIKNSSDMLNDFQLKAELLQVKETITPIDTNTVPVDFSITPVIQANSTSATLHIKLACGDDNICYSDLSVELKNITYKNSKLELTNEQSHFVIGDTSYIEYDVIITNNGEDAFETFLSFVLQSDTFTSVLLQNTSTSITCASTQNNTIINTVCKGLKSPLKEDDVLTLRFRLTANETIEGNQEDVRIPVSVGIPDQFRNEENSSQTHNNDATIHIRFKAITKYVVDLYYRPNSTEYFGNGSATMAINASSNLGRKLGLRVLLDNFGPSPFTGNVALYIPARNTPDIGEFYYYYPANLEVNVGEANKFVCDSSQINPDKHTFDFTRSNRRRKRNNGNILSAARSLHRIIKRQSSVQFNLDCQTMPDNCIKVNCIAELNGRSSAYAEVTGYIDERFFSGKDDTYHFRAYAIAMVTDGFTEAAEDSINHNTATIEYKKLSMSSDDIPILIIIICPIVVAIVFILGLGICLYFLGFFRMRKLKQMKQQSNLNPYEDAYTPDTVTQRNSTSS